MFRAANSLVIKQRAERGKDKDSLLKEAMYREEIELWLSQINQKQPQNNNHNNNLMISVREESDEESGQNSNGEDNTSENSGFGPLRLGSFLAARRRNSKNGFPGTTSPSSPQPIRNDGNQQVRRKKEIANDINVVLLKALADKDKIIRKLEEKHAEERHADRERLRACTALLQTTRAQLNDCKYDLAIANEKIRKLMLNAAGSGGGGSNGTNLASPTAMLASLQNNEPAIDLDQDVDVIQIGRNNGKHNHNNNNTGRAASPSALAVRSPSKIRLSETATTLSTILSVLPTSNNDPSSCTVSSNTVASATAENASLEETATTTVRDEFLPVNYNVRGFWRPLFKNLRTVRRMSVFSSAFEMHDFVLSKGIADLDFLIVQMMESRIRAEDFAKAIMAQPQSLRQMWIQEVGTQLKAAASLLKLLDIVYIMNSHCGHANRAKIGEVVTQTVCEALQVCGARLYLVDGASLILLGQKIHGDNNTPSAQVGKRFSIEGIVGECIKLVAPMCISNIASHPKYKADVDGIADFLSPNIAVYPIQDVNQGGRVLGTLIAIDDDGPISKIGSMLLAAISNQVAPILASLIAYNAAWSTTHIARVRFTMDNTRDVETKDELLALLGGFVRRAKELLGCERYALFMREEDSSDGTSSLHAFTDQGIHICMAMDRSSAVGHCAVTNQTVVIQDAPTDHRFNKEVDKSTGFTTRNILAVPLRNAGGQVIGVVQMLNKRTSWSDADLDLLNTFAQFCSIMVERSRYYQNIKGAPPKKWEAIRNLLQQAEIVLDVDAVKLFTIDTKAAAMTPYGSSVAYQGRQGQPLTFNLSRDSGVAGFVAMTGETIKLGGVTAALEDPRYKFEVDHCIGRGCWSLLSEPCYNGRSVCGVLHAINKRSAKSFSWEDEALMNIVVRKMEQLLIMKEE